MTKRHDVAVLAILAACLAGTPKDAVFAQGGPAPMAGAETAGAPTAGEPAGDRGPSSDTAAEGAPTGASARQAAILMVTSVEVIRSVHPPQLDMVRVQGLTSDAGWTDPSLKPLTEGVPPDGILDLVFVADAPATASTPMGFSPIAIVFPIRPGHPFKGVRVQSRSNAITVPEIPGYVQAPSRMNDCAKCVGKIFIATGGAIPDGKTDADVVKEENLPPVLRIIRPADGISVLESNPNRLTLVLDGDGRIIDANWD